MKNWKNKARIDYETTNMTLQEIAQKYKKNAGYVRSIAGKESWGKKGYKVNKEIEQKIEQKKEEIIEKKASEIEKLVEDELKLKQRVLKELASLAFVDIRKIFNGDMSLKSITELDDETAAALAGCELINTRPPGEGKEPEWTKKFKLWDKKAALSELMKCLGMFEKDNRQQQQTIINVVRPERKK